MTCQLHISNISLAPHILGICDGDDCSHSTTSIAVPSSDAPSEEGDHVSGDHVSGDHPSDDLPVSGESASNEGSSSNEEEKQDLLSTENGVEDHKLLEHEEEFDDIGFNYCQLFIIVFN